MPSSVKKIVKPAPGGGRREGSASSLATADPRERVGHVLVADERSVEVGQLYTVGRRSAHAAHRVDRDRWKIINENANYLS